MHKFVGIVNKLEHCFNYFCTKAAYYYHSCRDLTWPFRHTLIFRIQPVWIQLIYFTTLSLAGYLLLKVSKPRTTSFSPKDIDVFFTSLSSATVSSMSTVEMEVFSNGQLVVMAILMLAGGEVFVSMLALQLKRFKFAKKDSEVNTAYADTSNSTNSLDLIENGSITHLHLQEDKSFANEDLKHSSIKCLASVVFGYFLIINVLGSALVSIYVNVVPSAREVLENKGINKQTFSTFTTISTFSNAGFVPTNENMIAFKKNTGLLLILIPQVLMGNTLYPVCLRLVILVLEKLTKRVEFRYLLKNYKNLGYSHLFSGLHSCFLAVTASVFILVQFIFFCSMEWNSEGLDGLNFYQKLVASLSQVVNSRHAGESIIDLSIISPAILLMFIVMMYLPSYTYLLPIKYHKKLGEDESRKLQKINSLEFLSCSQLSYLVIFIIIVCITERKKLKEDPLNFNVLNITLEVISAYGNVGFSTGYSCKRQLNPDPHCTDKWHGFAGRWSNVGKFILILVMFFGRLKKFHMGGGRAWKLV